MSKTIHWVGTGLSAIPGLQRLIDAGHAVVVWNRSLDRAREAVQRPDADLRAYDPDVLATAVAPGDIVVSMLPAEHHLQLAELCIAKGANFVSSSYIAPVMRDLDPAAKAAGVALVNEVGLDPGIDHLMAHDLVAEYRRIAQPGDVVSFTSYCGGVPLHPDAFKYKFSWSPLGVLRALRSHSVSLRDGQRLEVDRPWHAITAYDAPLPVPERFEVYPNRDSLPFIDEYGFDPAWQVRDFVRGTIRLEGWQDAWSGIFREVETLHGPEGDARLAELADQLWRDHAYAPDEPDRVVLCVALTALRDGAPVFDREWVLDAHGTEHGTAMAQLVSIPVAKAVEAVADGRFAPGVHAAPDDPEMVRDWLAEVGTIAQHMTRLDRIGQVSGT